MKWPSWFSSTTVPPKQERTDEEERDRILALANEFDKTVNTIGWETVLQHMAGKINEEITTATACPLEPEKQRIHVIRWNAMRELLDAGTGFINSTCKERDRIVNEEREYQEWLRQQQQPQST